MTVALPPDVLPEFPVFSEFADVANPAHYLRLPDDWLLAVADVVSSRTAIAGGNYKTVNMAGASVITAVLNALGRPDLPFVFGGDGATVAIPESGEMAARQALADSARWIADELQLEMRVALVPLSAVRAAGFDVQVSLFRTGTGLAYAMFSGGGSAWAEDQMKQGQFAVPPSPEGAQPDLHGLSCRWSPLPSHNGNVVSIIVAPGKRGADAAFSALVTEVVAATASPDHTPNPVPVNGPAPIVDFSGVETEVRTHPEPERRRARLLARASIVMVWLSYRTGISLGRFNARRYVREIRQNTDFRKFDDGLKMTVDIDDMGLRRIEAMLSEAAERGDCYFGVHRQDSALMTCIVPGLGMTQHMHFVDGADGGYARAAVKMKEMVAGSEALNA